jgi:tetratricopeptide (TPR) repeat protein
MPVQTLRFASRLSGALLMLFLIQTAAAQKPNDPPKDPLKDPAKENPDEQKAKEAFVAGKFDDALKALQAAAKTNLSMAPPKVVLAQWCVETQQGQQARLLIEQAAAEDPTHPQVLLTNASFALAEGRITDTIMSCAAALQHADNPRWDAERKKTFQREARTGLVAAFDLRGDYASVKTHLLALLDADAKNAVLRQKLARANFLLNRPEDAFADLKTAFKDDPTLDPPELTMAQLWTGKADFVKAEEWYGKAVSEHGKSAKVHRGFAEYLLNRGKIDFAKGHIEAAQKIEPNARETKALIGLSARYSKDYAKASPIFEELVRDYPTYAFAAINLALVLAESGDAKAKERAIGLTENNVKQNQRSADARAIYAYCLFKAGRATDAERIARSVVGLGQLGLDGAFFYAKILADRGANEDAHKVLKVACENKDWFVYRKDAEALFAELDKKVPPPKK